ncbi:unnamed protein product [Bursaphelenchus xylophilus]|uniref:(pine wood nematode) hypothetical protein n=1 Tax=Bursaphelenchus xylophilus TaxID=6326 RepID=A0A1I7RZG7_BURXY|nr:unnamed protein product [Bursaphelenchus xylophilus]CAG9106410.1 unnamed protein product [Bursaphelenchus xylophilus]
MYGFLQTAISVVSMILSSIVVYVVFFHSPRSMGTYTRFITNFTLCDFMMSFCVGFVVRPFPIFPFDGGLVEGFVRGLGDTGGAISFAIILNALAYCLSAQCACIIYRFSVLLDNKAILQFVVSKITWTFAYTGNVIFTIGTTYLSVKLQVRREDLQYFLRDTASHHPEVPIPNLDNEVYIYMNFSGTIATITGLLVVFGFMIVEIISLGCVFTIFHQMEVKKHTFSPTTYKMHRQLTAALLAQVIAPIIFIMLPVMYIMFGRYYRSGLSELTGQVLVLCMDMYGGISSMITLYFIAPYRRVVFKAMWGWRSSSKRVEEWKTEPWAIRTKSISTRGRADGLEKSLRRGSRMVP